MIKERCAKEIRIFQSYKHILKILNGLGPHIESIHMHMLYTVCCMYIFVPFAVLKSIQRGGTYSCMSTYNI